MVDENTLLFLAVILLISWLVLRPARQIPPGDEPVRGHDLCWFVMDNQIPFIINAFQIMDDISLDDARRIVADRMVAKQPRLRNKVVFRGGRPYWTPDTNFALENHVYVDTDAQVRSEKELQAYIDSVYTRNMDPNRPLWEMILLPNYLDGKCVLVSRFHHVVGDGIALVTMVFKAIDAPPAAARAPVKVGQSGSTLALVKNLRNNVSAAVRVAWSQPVPLAEVKFIKNTFGCSINDVVVACVAAGLRAYLEKTGGLKDTDRVRASLPVNIRAAKGNDVPLENYFGIVYFGFPVHEADRLKRLELVKSRAAAMKASVEPHLTLLGLSLIANLPMWLAKPVLHFMSSKATLVFSNVPGLQEVCSFGGKDLHELHFFAPAGVLPISISVLSYAQGVSCNIAVDKDACSDPDFLAHNFVAELNAFHALAKAKATS
uniref:Secreted protein n=1 Tax=Achlya hypogyna TaxID=1202772 RepID=A0A0A7CPI1_ACHHY|nr:secreted protein [Achlya hypogyna]